MLKTDGKSSLADFAPEKIQAYENSGRLKVRKMRGKKNKVKKNKLDESRTYTGK